MTEVAVGVFGDSVAGLACVDDDHGPALAAELECGGEPGGRSPDDGDVAVPLDAYEGVLTHLPARYSADHGSRLVLRDRGKVGLSLGEREITVETGEAAQFATLMPLAVAAVGGSAALIMIFEPDRPRASRNRWPSDAVILTGPTPA